jgi:hypothetical protein
MRVGVRGHADHQLKGTASRMDDDLKAKLGAFLDARPGADGEASKRHIDVVRRVDGLSNVILQHDAEDKARHSELKADIHGVHTELRGEIRGVSLRVGMLEKADMRHEKAIDETGKHEVLTLREKNRNVWSAVGAVIMLALGGVLTWLTRGK